MVNGGSSASGENVLPMYCSTTFLNFSTPQLSMRYFKRDCLRSSRRP